MSRIAQKIFVRGRASMVAWRFQAGTFELCLEAGMQMQLGTGISVPDGNSLVVEKARDACINIGSAWRMRA